MDAGACASPCGGRYRRRRLNPTVTPAVPPLPLEPGLDQGQRVTLRETLTRRPGRGGRDVECASAPSEDGPAARCRAAGALAAAGRPGKRLHRTALLRRARADQPRSARGVERGTRRAAGDTPLRAGAGHPDLRRRRHHAGVDAAARAPSLRRRPPPTACWRRGPSAGAEATTSYNVYAAGAEAAPDALGVVTRAAPLNAAPIDGAAVTARGVTFGQERCFVVRAVSRWPARWWRGRLRRRPALPRWTPSPRPPPTALEAVGGAGVISLIWEAVEAPDLAGYLVFRGEATGEPTTPLTAGADWRHQLRGPHRHAGRALCLRRRRGRLGHARQPQRAVEPRGRNGATVEQGSGAGPADSGDQGEHGQDLPGAAGDGRAVRGRARQRALLARR